MKIIGGCKLACFFFFFGLLIVDGIRSFYLNTDELARLKQKNNADITNKLEFFFDDDESSGSGNGGDGDSERKDSRIIGASGSLKEFPGSFQVRLNANNKSHLLKFNKILRSPEESSKQSIFTLDSKTRRPFKYMDASVGEEFELYKQQNGKGIATLIRNKHWNGLSSSSSSSSSSSNSKQPFRMLGTIFSDDTSSSIALDIMPVHLNPNKKAKRANAAYYSDTDGKSGRVDEDDLEKTKKLLDELSIDENFGYDNENDAYAVFQRDLGEFTDDEITRQVNEQLKKALKEHEERPMNRYRRAVNGQPITLYVELLLVTDFSIYAKMQAFSGLTAQNDTFSFMRIYYTHLINAVNQRFATSLATDADLRIIIKITKFLFLLTTENWANSSIVGDSAYPKYNGKEVLAAQPSLDAFTKYMNDRAATMGSYDFAIGLVDKDIWSSLMGTPANRSLTYSFSYIGQVCTSYRYSIAEEVGGFANINVIAQEVGKILGSYYDGEVTASACSASSNYIMTPTLGAISTNLANQFIFSSCSIAQFKSILLTNSFTAVSAKATCLTNTPSVSDPSDNVSVYNLPGQSMSADDQCKMIYGPTASFCIANSGNMCTQLSCRKSENATVCTSTPGFGAAEGTVCGSAQICSNGVCINSTLAPTSSCPFGDDVIVNSTLVDDALPSIQLSCNDFILYLLSVGKTPFSYCSNTTFRAACCNTCKIYDKFTCVDKYASCSSFSEFCDDLIKKINGELVNKACERTCNQCEQTLKCSDNLCQNGNCLDVPSTPNNLISFVCDCPTGYSGLFCEIKNPCAGTPCSNGGTCVKFGSTGYYCLCPSSYTGQNCSTAITTTSPATTISGQTTPSVTSTLPANLCSTRNCSNGLCFQLSANVSYCSCYANYSGDSCQFVSPCATSPCKNSGTCFPQFFSADYFCFCPPGFTGKTCDIDLKRQCQYNNGNCQNGATCYVDSVTFQAQCNCPPLYSGPKCDQYMNPCFKTNGYPVCLNGNCTINANSAPYYSCTCYSGYFGTNCESSSNTTPNPLNCADQDTKLCLIYAQNGYCGSSLIINGLTVDRLCPKSCNTCSTTLPAATTQSATCVDSDPGCSYWSYYCSLLASISPHPCRKTCGMC